MAENVVDKKAEKALIERLGEAWATFRRLTTRVRGWVRVVRVILRHVDGCLEDLGKLEAEGTATDLDG